MGERGGAGRRPHLKAIGSWDDGPTVRLLVVSNVYPPVVRGGYEVECRDVVEHLRRTHDVSVLASSLDAEATHGEPHVHRVLPWTGDHRRADSVRGLLLARRALTATRRALAELGPEAIYVWNAAGMPSVVLRALQLSGLPLLVRVCEYWFTGIYRHDPVTRYLPGGSRPPGTALGGPEAAWARATRIGARALLDVDWTTPVPAAVCWNSAFVRRATPAPQGFAVVHGDVVIPSNARTDELEDIPRRPQAGRVLFVGRLDERKGAATVVRALGRLRSRGVEATLHLVGQGTDEEREVLRALAAAEGVADRVTCPGPLWGEALRREIGEAAAWCVPSVWDEPAPLTCTEAALARVPAVFSRVGGIPEMFAEEDQALYHDPGDADACAAALERQLTDGPAAAARVARALVRGRELSFGPYVAAMDRFLDDGLAALSAVPTAAPRS